MEKRRLWRGFGGEKRQENLGEKERKWRSNGGTMSPTRLVRWLKREGKNFALSRSRHVHVQRSGPRLCVKVLTWLIEMHRFTNVPLCVPRVRHLHLERSWPRAIPELLCCLCRGSDNYLLSGLDRESFQFYCATHTAVETYVSWAVWAAWNTSAIRSSISAG